MHLTALFHKFGSVVNFSTEVWVSILLGAALSFAIAFLILPDAEERVCHPDAGACATL